MTAALKNRIKESIENKTSTENDLENNKREIETNKISYAEIINEYTKKSDEIRAENEGLVNMRETLSTETECKEKECDNYKNEMESLLNQYRESEENAKKCFEDWTLKAEELKKNIDNSDEEMKNMELAVEKRCKLMEEETEQKIQNLAKEHEKVKTATKKLADVKQNNYLADIQVLYEARQNKNIEISELKSVKANLQKELDKQMNEISQLSTEIETIEKRNKEKVISKSNAVQVSGIEKLMESEFPNLPMMTPKDRVNLLTESSDETFRYQPKMDIESEWQKLLKNNSGTKLQTPVRPKLSKPTAKYDVCIFQTVN